MNIQYIDSNYSNLNLLENELNFLNNRFSILEKLFENNTLYAKPGDDLKSGIFFKHKNLSQNTGSIYVIDKNTLFLYDTNECLYDLFHTDIGKNYLNFIEFSKEKLEIKPHFLHQRLMLKDLHFICKSQEKISIKISYYKRMTSNLISLIIPIESLNEGQENIYKNIILRSLYSEYKSIFQDFVTEDDFVNYSDEMFSQVSMMNY